MNAGWKKGRGKLGILQPLMGPWIAEFDSEMGKGTCTRVFERALQGAYIRLEAQWKFTGSPKTPEQGCEEKPSTERAPYEEMALIGVGSESSIRFWSFTSDGKRSEGVLADVTDIHARAIGFEAQMPAGLARMAYWPDDAGGFYFVVELKNAGGWNRFLKHQYRANSG